MASLKEIASLKIFDINLKTNNYLEENELESPGIIRVIEENCRGITFDSLITGHCGGSIFTSRMSTPPTYLNRLGISRNWVKKIYTREYYMQNNRVFNLTLDENSFGCNKKNDLIFLDRDSLNEISTFPGCNAYAKNHNTIFGSTAKGYFILEDHQLTNLGSLGNNASDHYKELAVSNEIFVISNLQETIMFRRVGRFNVIEHVGMISRPTFSKDSRFLYGILEDPNDMNAITKLDIETGTNNQLTAHEGIGARFRDIKVKDDKIILTANEDKSLRLYDKREDQNPVIKWGSPTAELYKFDYDGINAVLAACERKDVILYDLRKTKSPIQKYVVHKDGRNFITSIVCDMENMFVGTWQGVVKLNFKVANKKNL